MEFSLGNSVEFCKPFLQKTPSQTLKGAPSKKIDDDTDIKETSKLT